MDSNLQELESVRKKCEALDNELNTFFQSLKEIKSLKESVSEIPDKLKQNEEDIENQKREIENMLSSTSNLLITFEEQAKGLFFDLEKKTDNLAGNVKISISELKNIFESNKVRFQEEQKEKLRQILEAYEEIRTSFENMNNSIIQHEQSISSLQNNYAEIIKIFDRSELSFREIKRSLADLQKKPHDAENRMRAMENRLQELFFTKLERQKYIILTILSLIITSIIIYVFYNW